METKEITRAFAEQESIRVHAARLRSGLSGQKIVATRARVEAEWGLALPITEIRERIRAILPRRPFKTRTVACALVTTYERFIPDAALVRWQEARDSGLFQSFCIMWPVYQKIQVPPPDPWLIGWTAMRWASIHHYNGEAHHADEDRGIVLAYWDDARLHPPQAGT